MLKRPLVVGCKGSMGQRYLAILKHLGIDALAVDKDEPIPTGYDCVIIATPTDQHFFHANLFDSVPILMEKPLADDFDLAMSMCDEFDRRGTKVRMVNQYIFLAEPKAEGPTHYDYFRSGKDGLYLDCISIIALAKGSVSLRQESPIWTCCINGQYLNLKDMDGAYCHMVEHFLHFPPVGPETDYIRDAHTKVSALMEADRDD